MLRVAFAGKLVPYGMNKFLSIPFLAMALNSALLDKSDAAAPLQEGSNGLIQQQLTPPQFPGGNDGLYSYIMGQLKWPAGKYRVATLIVTFYVEKDGSLSNIVVEQSISDEFDAQAVGLLKRSPKWVPAKRDGLPIKSKYRLPIRFHVDKELNTRKDTVFKN